jgi:hypothetical protein
MKTCILFAAIISLTAAAPSAVAPQNSYAAYVAGVELIVADKTLDPAEQARRYRRLCEITGVTGEKAKSFLQQLKSDPAGWQKFETLVMDLLQKKG